MSLIASSTGCFSGLDFCLIFAPAATMIQKASLRENPALSQTLTLDTRKNTGRHRHVAMRKSASGRGRSNFQAAATTPRHVLIAAARSTRWD